MQQNYHNPVALRNSSGFTQNNYNPPRSPNQKSFNHSQQQNYPLPDSLANTIRNMEGKIEGVQAQNRKKGYLQIPEQPSSANYAMFGKQRFPNQYSGEALQEYQLRGSCQNIIKKFDYSNLRNTTQYNLIDKNKTKPQFRRSPQEGKSYRDVHVNQTQKPQSISAFLKAQEKKIIQNKYSFIANSSKTPPKNYNQKLLTSNPPSYHSRSPAQFKTIIQKKDPQNHKINPEEKKIFKTLNQIIETKNQEKIIQQNIKSSLIKQNLINGFEVGPVLGKGKFGEVWLGRHRETGFISAIKKLQKERVRQLKMSEQLCKQIRLHSALDHPNIVKFYGVFEQKESIYLVMQYLDGGTLFDCLNEVGTLSLKEACLYLRDVIEALNYMHSKSIAHRDIKPQNIVVSSQGVVKLCDFGWSALVQTSRKTYCGTFDYAPPEILQRKNYDMSVDIWCIGVLTYELLAGRVPFEGEQRNLVMQKILNIDKAPIQFPQNFPSQAKQFVQCLMQKDPALRPKCQDLLNFKLFQMHLPKGKAKKI